MHERKKIIIKLIILLLIQGGCNYAIVLWGQYVKWNPKLHFSRMEGLGIELLFMIFFQMFIYVNYRVNKLTITKYKVIYILTDLLFLLLTFLFWCVIVVGPLWFPDP